MSEEMTLNRQQMGKKTQNLLYTLQNTYGKTSGGGNILRECQNTISFMGYQVVEKALECIEEQQGTEIRKTNVMMRLRLLSETSHNEKLLGKLLHAKMRNERLDYVNNAVNAYKNSNNFSVRNGGAKGFQSAKDLMKPEVAGFGIKTTIEHQFQTAKIDGLTETLTKNAGSRKQQNPFNRKAMEKNTPSAQKALEENLNKTEKNEHKKHPDETVVSRAHTGGKKSFFKKAKMGGVGFAATISGSATGLYFLGSSSSEKVGMVIECLIFLS